MTTTIIITILPDRDDWTGAELAEALVGITDGTEYGLDRPHGSFVRQNGELYVGQSDEPWGSVVIDIERDDR